MDFHRKLLGTHIKNIYSFKGLFGSRFYRYRNSVTFQQEYIRYIIDISVDNIKYINKHYKSMFTGNGLYFSRLINTASTT